MKYTVTRLDGRYAYHKHFEFYLGFSKTMARQHGPLAFNDAMTWFIKTYGWSAEVQQWQNINLWTSNTTLGLPIAAGILPEPSEHCNKHWSWANSYQDLRIYLSSQQELMFFQLAHPLDKRAR